MFSLKFENGMVLYLTKLELSSPEEVQTQACLKLAMWI